MWHGVILFKGTLAWVCVTSVGLKSAYVRLVYNERDWLKSVEGAYTTLLSDVSYCYWCSVNGEAMGVPL